MAKKKVFNISEALTEGLEETITAAQNYSGELRVEVIPIKKIEVDPDNPRDLALTFQDLYNGIAKADTEYLRKEEEKSSLQTLAYSIKEQGIINPIMIYKHGDRYRLIAGERRTMASILAGKVDIQAKILDSKPNRLKVSLLQWIENMERADLTLWERIANLEKIVAAFTLTQSIPANQITITELSNLLGCSKPHAMNYKAILTADEPLRELIRCNKIRNLEKAALISNIRAQDVKQRAIDACITGTTLKKLKAIVELENNRQLIEKKHKQNLRRGRQTLSVNFGMTKNLAVARTVFESILANGLLTEQSIQLTDVDWNDYKSVTEVFRQLLKTLEASHP